MFDDLKSDRGGFWGNLIWTCYAFLFDIYGPELNYCSNSWIKTSGASVGAFRIIALEETENPKFPRL